MFDYKATKLGIDLIKVNEAYTTQICNNCGARSGHKGQEELGVRSWICNNCNLQYDRDINSAINILN